MEDLLRSTALALRTVHVLQDQRRASAATESVRALVTELELALESTREWERSRRALATGHVDDAPAPVPGVVTVTVTRTVTDVTAVHTPIASTSHPYTSAGDLLPTTRLDSALHAGLDEDDAPTWT